MATTITANGINFPDGSAGSPSIGGSDTNTGLFTGSDIVGFATGGSERLRIDASGNVNIANDSGKLQLGTSADLQIYHDGTHSRIKNDTGTLFTLADEVRFKNNANNETLLVATANGAVELYHDNSKKFETYANGCTVTGNLNAGNVDLADNAKARFGGSNDLEIYHDGSNSIINDNGTGSLRIQTGGTNHWEFGDPFLKGNDGRKIILGDSSDLQIYHDGSDSFIDDAGTGNLFIRSSQLQINKYTGENMIKAVADGAVELYYNNSKRLDTSSDGISTHSAFQGTGSPGVIHAKTGGGASNQVFVGCSANNTDFCGGLRRDGASLAVELFNGSDRRIKNNIAPMPSVLSKLNQIELKTYNYKNDNTASGRGPIAQDLINVFPEKVVKTDDGTGDTLPSDVEPWSIGNNFTWELIKGVQELSAKVETLETKIEALEAA